MRTAPRRPMVVALLLAASACASGADPTSRDPLGLPESFSSTYRAEPTPHQAVFQSSVDAVAERVPDVYGQLGLPVGRAGRTAVLTFTTSDLRIGGRLYEDERNSEYFSCGSGMSGPRADTYEIEFTLLTRVRENPGGEGTLVETMIGARARDRYASTTPVPCRGTGKLEEAALATLRRMVR